MARGIERLIAEMAREAERQERARRRAAREAERARKAAERSRIALETERKRRYLQDRADEVSELNAELEARIETLTNLLRNGITRKAAVAFNSLWVEPEPPTLELGDLTQQEPVPQWREPAKPGWISGWLPPVKSRYRTLRAAARREFELRCHEHAEREASRQRAIERAKEEHRATVQKIEAEAASHNAKIREWEVAYRRGEREAVEEYITLALRRSPRPDGFPKKFRVAYVTESKQAVIEYELPEMDAVIPKHKKHTYVKASDRVQDIPLPEKQRRAMYSDLIAQDTLLAIHEVITSDIFDWVESVVFNGIVDTINPGTGQRIRPCVVTVRTTCDLFSGLNLQNVEPTAALGTLSAAFSKSPAELAPVRPILEFDMVDPRFIKESDVLSKLDQRPNLMELTPGEFESLITNLFQKMGLETKLTQASRDGGVDCVAYDPRPIFGGKVVIQAKRYKNTVGVSAVRDLFGTMQNEGASKGILVTTSGYGKAAFDFSSGKPMELLDGGNLLYLLKTHAGIDAKVVAPDSWRDASGDESAIEA